jgi:hypothetical protein
MGADIAKAENPAKPVAWLRRRVLSNDVQRQQALVKERVKQADVFTSDISVASESFVQTSLRLPPRA